MSPRLLRLVVIGVLAIPLLLIGLFLRTLLAPVDLSVRLEAIKNSSVLLDRNGREITTLYGQGRVWVPLSRMPLFIRRAVVATEDLRFYQHRGIDPRGILRALYQNVRSQRVQQGGSTITQQLAKIAFLTNRRTIWRKAEDIALALRIERYYSKDQILEFYLNNVYLGAGASGVEAGAQTYFGRHVWELNEREQALLIGLIRGPGYYSPFQHRSASLARARTVLDLTRAANYAHGADWNAIRAQAVRLLASPGRSYPGGYFVAEILDRLEEQFGWSEEYIRRAGLQIHSTMDVETQRAAEDALRLLPIGYKDTQGAAQPQGAVVVLDPQSGAVRALVGGRDYLTAPFNRATRARRQPGSAIKPFAYAAAMESGYTPDSVFLDEPTGFWVNGQLWRPVNYDRTYRGPIPLRLALEDSVNVVSVRLVEQLGPQAVFGLARRMGLRNLVGSGTRNDVGLAPLALGGLTNGVTPLELTAAYAAFANGGQKITPYFYTRVTDRRGRVIAAAGPRREQVLSSQAAYLVTDMLRGVITRGTGTRAGIGRPAAGKTGTTTDYTNGWFIGYTPQLLAGVWIGNDEGGRPMRTKGGNLGSGFAAALWGVLMSRALAAQPVLDFPSPWSGRTVLSIPEEEAPPAPAAVASPTRGRPFSTAWWDVVRERLRGLLGVGHQPKGNGQSAGAARQGGNH